MCSSKPSIKHALSVHVIILLVLAQTVLHSQTLELHQMPYAKLKEKAEGGDSNAMVQLALRFHYGPDAPMYSPLSEHWSQANRWFEKAAAAGNPSASALCALVGWGRSVDRDFGFQTIKKAAETGENNVALRLLGRCYEYGWGCDPDPAKAFSLYQRALDRVRDAATLHALGVCHIKGVGTDAAAATGLALIEEAAAMGSGLSVEVIASFNADGSEGVVKNPEKAEALYLQAHQMGYPGALASILEMKRKAAKLLTYGGPEVEKDPEAARQAWETAIENGNALLEEFPDNVELRLKLGEVMVEAGRSATPPTTRSASLKAIRLCEDAFRNAPESIGQGSVALYFGWVQALAPLSSEELKKPEPEADPVDKTEFVALIDDALQLSALAKWPVAIEPFCRLLIERGRIWEESNNHEEAAATYQKVVDLATPALEMEPWDYYLRDKLAGAFVNLSKAKRALGDPAGELRAIQEYLQVWAIPYRGIEAVELVAENLPPTEANLTRIREQLPTAGMKMFVISCDVGGVMTPVEFYIGNGLTPEGFCRSFEDQAQLVWRRNGFRVPEDTHIALRKLAAIAKENKVGFVDLCTYALNFPAETKTTDQLLKEAEKGDFDAMNSLGVAYQKGDGVVKDLPKALEWFQKSADGGNAWGQWNLGKLYANGRGVPRDQKKAFGLFAKAGEQHHGAATHDLAACYEYGIGTEKDIEKAVELYQKAAALGNEDSNARLKELAPN